jgi:hypothetical protein
VTALLRRQAIPILTLVVAFVATGVVIQLWLLSASLEAYLAGDAAPSVPATVASALLLLVNGALLGFVLQVDRRARLSGPR